MIKNGSESLLVATKNQKYIKEVTILVPETWTHRSEWGTVRIPKKQYPIIMLKV